VKVRSHPFASERGSWTAENLAWLRGRGYPAPEIHWYGDVDWQRLHLANAGSGTADGGERLVDRIVEIAGEQGLRCTNGYAAIARLALGRQRGERDQLETWRQVTDAMIDRID